MKEIALAELVTDVNGSLTGAGDARVSALSTDTRELPRGAVFVAIPGEHVDGASLARTALDAGAVAVMTENPERAQASGAPQDSLIVVDDVIRAMGAAARGNVARLRSSGNSAFRIIGVTGSVGKTTTKDLLAALVADRGPVIAPPGSFNNELGLPMTALRADETTATLVVEMGADHMGNIEYLTSIAQPDIGVVLIVARAHLGEFGGIENVARAKSELVSGTRAGGTVVLNADDPRVAAMASLAHGPVIFFSPSGRTHEGVWAEGVSIDKNGHAHFTLVHGDERASVHLALVGAHHVANAVAAAAVARVCGMTVARIAEVLSVTGPASPHRMDIRSVDGVTIIDDSYNANPDSMKAGIEALGRIGAGRRKIAVLGSMLELGEASDAEHRMLLPSLVAARAGILVTVGREMEPLAVVAKETGMDVYSAEGDREAEDLVRHLIRPDDVVLLKGSHGSGIWRIANRMSGGN